MNLTAKWIEGPAINAAPEEAATLCDLRIFVDGENACRFIDFEEVDQEKQKGDHLTIPAVYLAEGLATDWWSIFGSRDWLHRIQRYRTGFALPDIVLRSHGTQIEIVSGDNRLLENPHLQFNSVNGETISRIDAEAVLSRFIKKVADKLSSDNIRNSELQARWNRVSLSRCDEDERAFCEAAGALGLDPYTISKEDAIFVESANELFSKEVLLEFLSGLRASKGTWSPLSYHLVERTR